MCSKCRWEGKSNAGRLNGKQFSVTNQINNNKLGILLLIKFVTSSKENDEQVKSNLKNFY